MKIIREYRFAQAHMNLFNTSHYLKVGNYFFVYRNQKFERDRKKKERHVCIQTWPKGDMINQPDEKGQFVRQRRN